MIDCELPIRKTLTCESDPLSMWTTHLKRSVVEREFIDPLTPPCTDEAALAWHSSGPEDILTWTWRKGEHSLFLKCSHCRAGCRAAQDLYKVSHDYAPFPRFADTQKLWWWAPAHWNLPLHRCATPLWSPKPWQGRVSQDKADISAQTVHASSNLLIDLIKEEEEDQPRWGESLAFGSWQHISSLAVGFPQNHTPERWDLSSSLVPILHVYGESTSVLNGECKFSQQ